MKKKLPVTTVIIVVLVVLGVCGAIYSFLPIGPNINPEMPKGSNRPPPGTRAHKNDGMKTQPKGTPEGMKTNPKGTLEGKNDGSSSETKGKPSTDNAPSN